jgi:hypothetical protein
MLVTHKLVLRTQTAQAKRSNETATLCLNVWQREGSPTTQPWRLSDTFLHRMARCPADPTKCYLTANYVRLEVKNSIDQSAEPRGWQWGAAGSWPLNLKTI